MTVSAELADIRRQYQGAPLGPENLDADPFAQFQLWLDNALHAEVIDGTAMTLATSNAQGRPGVRTVLLKSFDASGFVFYTSYLSRKAQDMADNDQVSLLMYWRDLSRQIVVEGRASKVSRDQSAEYFATRPRGSQFAAAISAQSQAVPDRAHLQRKVEALAEQLGEAPVPCPETWGGYRVVPDRFEFWQGRPDRLHDRFEYRLESGAWSIARLAP